MTMLARWIAVGALLATTTMSALPGGQVTAHEGPAEGPEFKALSDLAVHLDTESLSRSGGDVTVDVASRSGVNDLDVSLSSTGPIRVDSAAAAVSAGSDSIDLVVQSVTGAGTITAAVSGVDADGESVSAIDRLWVDEHDGQVFVSEIGQQDLELIMASFGASTSSVDEIIRGDLSVGQIEVERAALGTCEADRVCVEGTAMWTDSVGNRHPVPGADVEVRLSGDAGAAAIVRTDEAGVFEASLIGAENRDMFVRILASGDGFEIVRRGTLQPQFIDSPTITGVPAGTIVDVPLVANGVDDNHTAFSLHHSMVIARAYLETVQPETLPDVQVVFPSNGSFYDGLRINMLQLDRWDWDVMIHEFGHFVAEELGTQRNPGGPHSGRDNLADDPGRGKDEGVRLAWGEGWPTYFAVSALVEMDAAALGIPNVGDTLYQDTEDTNIVNDLEADALLGEDNEVTVMSVLWDLYDDVDDGLDSIALGDQFLWTAIDDADPETLTDFYNAVAPNSGIEFGAENCVFSQMNVAPLLAGDATQTIDATTPSPVISWRAGNGGISGENDRFVVEYRNATGSVVLHSSRTTTDLTYTAPDDVWASVVAGAGNAVSVTVTGVEVQAPQSGPYRSCERRFVSGGGEADSPFESIEPKRFADTRPTGATLDDLFESAGRRTAGSTYDIEFAGRGDVPADARAVVANVTAVQASDVGFVTAFDCSTPRPLASSLNYTAGVNLGNEVVISLNGDGRACLFSSASTHLTVDVVGYVSTGSRFSSVAPARILETRTGGQTTIDGRFEGVGANSAEGERIVTIAERAGVPTDAAAAVINVTAIGASANGFVTVHPCLVDLPLAASLNFVPRTNRGNELIAPLDEDGDICLYTSEQVHLTVDVVGYVPSATLFEPLDPARLLDTRASGRTIDGGDQQTGKRDAGDEYALQVAGRNGVTTQTDAVVLNVTAVQPEGTGFVTVHPCEATVPTASSLNHVDGVNGGNEIVAKLDADGQVCLFTSNATHLTVDIVGLLGR